MMNGGCINTRIAACTNFMNLFLDFKIDGIINLI